MTKNHYRRCYYTVMMERYMNNWLNNAVKECYYPKFEFNDGKSFLIIQNENQKLKNQLKQYCEEVGLNRDYYE